MPLGVGYGKSKKSSGVIKTVAAGTMLARTSAEKKKISYSTAKGTLGYASKKTSWHGDILTRTPSGINEG